MKELLEFLARSLVDEPDAVRVEDIQGESSLILQLHVDPDDVGKVIGRQGRIAKSMRTLVKAAAYKDGNRVTVEIVD